MEKHPQEVASLLKLRKSGIALCAFSPVCNTLFAPHPQTIGQATHWVQERLRLLHQLERKRKRETSSGLSLLRAWNAVKDARQFVAPSQSDCQIARQIHLLTQRIVLETVRKVGLTGHGLDPVDLAYMLWNKGYAEIERTRRKQCKYIICYRSALSGDEPIEVLMESGGNLQRLNVALALSTLFSWDVLCDVMAYQSIRQRLRRALEVCRRELEKTPAEKYLRALESSL